MSAENGAITRDPRVDRAVSWLLALLVTVVMTWVGTQLASLHTAVSDLRVEIARNADARARLEIHLSDMSIHHAAIEGLRARVAAVEEKMR